jgi:hypothetical protein
MLDRARMKHEYIFLKSIFLGAYLFKKARSLAPTVTPTRSLHSLPPRSATSLRSLYPPLP